MFDLTDEVKQNGNRLSLNESVVEYDYENEIVLITGRVTLKVHYGIVSIKLPVELGKGSCTERCFEAVSDTLFLQSAAETYGSTVDIVYDDDGIIRDIEFKKTHTWSAVQDSACAAD